MGALPTLERSRGGDDAGSGPVGPPQPGVGKRTLVESLASPGRALPAPVRAQMERSFDADFSGVTVHEGGHVAQLGAEAYAQGDEVHMAPGKLDPASEGGRALLGHELAHVVQQRQGRAQAPRQHKGMPVLADAGLEAEADAAGERAARGESVPGGLRGSRGGAPAGAPLQGKFVNLGNLVQPLFVSLPDTYAGDATPQLVLQTLRATGAEISEAREREVQELGGLTAHWLYNAMEVVRAVTLATGATLAGYYEALFALRDNRALLQAHDGGENMRFERQVLAAIGWFKRTMVANAQPPQPELLKGLSNTYNPPPVAHRQDDPEPPGALKEGLFRKQMSDALGAYLQGEHHKSTHARKLDNVGTLAQLADHIQEIAHASFAPFIGKTLASHDLAGFKYSDNVHDLETEDIPEAVIQGYLRNRAAMVGTTNTQIWHDTNFDAANPQHQAVLGEVLAPFAQHTPQLLEILRFTPRNDNGVVHFSRRVPPDANLHDLRWSQLYTLCHEYMHTLAHPDFTAAAAHIGRPQIVLEGFPEAFAYELKVSLRAAARNNPQFKALMERGVPDEQVREPPAPPLDYGGAATDAFNIIRSVGVLNARRAFFLGAVELAGLRADQKLAPEAATTLGEPVRLPEHHRNVPQAPDQQEAVFAQETRVSGFLPTPLYDVRTEVNGVAGVQVVRADVQDRFRELLAWKREHHHEDTARPEHEDYPRYARIRPLCVRYRSEHWQLRGRVERAPESATRSDVLELLDGLAHFAWGYLNSHDEQGASTVKKLGWQ